MKLNPVLNCEIRARHFRLAW